MNDKKAKIVIYKVQELSELLNTTPKTVRKFLNEGKIKGNKIGGQWLVEESAVLEFLRGDSK